jgi:hypothetical protein
MQSDLPPATAQPASPGSAIDAPLAGFRLGAIVGGVQKAGTTTLCSYLRAHPELLAPIRKETHFFDDEGRDWQGPDCGALRAFFPPGPAGRMAFDVTPIYLFWPSSLARIRNCYPAVRLIFLFRDPIERAWSHWRMERRRGAETLPFGAAIRDGRARLAGIAPLDPAWRVFSYVERGFYARQLQRLLSLFPREQILFLDMRQLAEQQETMLARIAAHLGISPFPPLVSRHDHAAPADAERLDPRDVDYLRRLFCDDVLEFGRLSGLRTDHWLTMRG